MKSFGTTTTTVRPPIAPTKDKTIGFNRAHAIAPEDFKVPQAGDDGITSLTWSPTQNYLASTNWDGGIRLWEVQEQGGQFCAVAKAMVRHEAMNPVLDCCFSPDGTTIFSAGGDKAVRMWRGENTPNNIAQQIGIHDAPVKAVRYLSSSNLVVSGGWDRKLKLWDQRNSNPAGSFDLPERIYGLDVQGNLMVAILANQTTVVYDARGQQPRLSKTDSKALSSQGRCVTCLPNQRGFAIGLLAGRVRCEVLPHSNAQIKSYSFRCHRHVNGQSHDAYSVNSIAFHPTYGTFATGGADGVVAFWHFEKKRKLTEFKPIQRPIPCLAFNARGNLLAYASSYDWSKGCWDYAHGSPNEIYVHCTPDSEIKSQKP